MALKNISLVALALGKRLRDKLRSPEGAVFPKVMYSCPRWRDVKNQLLQKFKQITGRDIDNEMAKFRSHSAGEQVVDVYGNVYRVRPDGSIFLENREFKRNR